MEKTTQSSDTTTTTSSKQVIWDCDSSLYDSFELNSFEKQLNSAISSSRSLSMPHLSDRRFLPPTPNKKPSRWSIHRLFRTVFRQKSGSSSSSSSSDVNKNSARFMQECTEDGFYLFYERSGVLSTIPEVPEFDALSPEIRSLVRRTASDRFAAAAAATSVGISCSSIGISGHFSI